MNTFGFFPGEPATPQEQLPGYAVAGVRIGRLHETVFSSLSFWSIEDYVQHWRQTARQCLARPTLVLFCTDLTPKLVCAFVGFPADRGVDFEEWIIPRKDLTVDGTTVSFRKPGTVTRETGSSTWRVTIDAISQFADAGGVGAHCP